MRRLALALLLVASPAGAIIRAIPYYRGPVDERPVCGTREMRYIATDAQSPSDCSALDGGTSRADCSCIDGSWVLTTKQFRVEGLSTACMDTGMVFAPNGTGGVECVDGGEGGGGPDDDVPEAGDFGNLSATAPITQSGGTISTSIATGRLVGRTTAGTGVMEAITPDATLALAGGSVGVVDVACTGCLGATEVAGLDAADTTTGTLADARVDGSAEADELVLVGDVDGAANAGDLDEAAVRDELEAVLRLQQLQSAVTDSQVPDSITVTLAATAAAFDHNPAACSASSFATDQSAVGALTCAQPAFSDLSGTATDGQIPNTITIDLATLATTATTANAGDSATAFFPAGMLEDARVDGSLEADEVNPTLGTQTQGNFVASVATTAPLSGGAAGSEGGVLTLTTSMATGKLLGRSTAGTGVAEEISVGSGLSLAAGTLSATGGGGGNAVEVSLTLAAAGLIYTATVTGQSWVTATSRIVCEPFATSADGLTVETYYAAALSVVAANRVAGTGFDIAVRNPNGASGTYRVNCLGV